MKKVLLTLAVVLLAGNAIEVNAFKKVSTTKAPAVKQVTPPAPPAAPTPAPKPAPASPKKRALTDADKQAIITLVRNERWTEANAFEKYQAYLDQHNIMFDDAFTRDIRAALPVMGAAAPALSENAVENAIRAIAAFKSETSPQDAVNYLNELGSLIFRMEQDYKTK